MTDIKGKVDGNTILVGNYNTALTSMHRSSRQKIRKTTEILNDTIEQLDLIDIFRTLHAKNQSTYSFQMHIEHSLGLTAYNTGDQGLIPGSRRSPGEGNGNPLQYLAWEIP